MEDKIIASVILLILTICICICIAINLDKWIRKRITKDAIHKEIEIKLIRESNFNDGQNPFEKKEKQPVLEVLVMGYYNDLKYYRIVETVDEEKYWTEIDTLFYIPSEVKWMKIKNGKNLI